MLMLLLNNGHSWNLSCRNGEGNHNWIGMMNVGLGTQARGVLSK